MARVSILIPCYNAASWLAGAIRSALEQAVDKEVIVVDDGSRDKSLEIARSFASEGVIVISQSNQGASAARNAALRRSSGDWIQYLDADDLLAPDKVARQLRAAEDAKDYAWTASWARFEEGIADARPDPNRLACDSDPVDWLVRKLSGHDMMHPAAWLTPRSVALRAGPWDERLSLDDDGEYFTRIVLASAGVRHCLDAVSYYRSNIASSLSHQRSESACRSALLSAQLSAQHLLAAEESLRTRSACASMFMRLAQSIYPQYPGLVEACENDARRLGGSAETPQGGLGFALVTRLLGWKAAKRIRFLRRSILERRRP